ncbi:hypothetical protein GCM10009814_37640 [Lapillicoccus jejuensis]
MTIVDTVGVRELRQNASDLLRRVEQGEELLITVSGRPAARITPVAADHWRRWDEVKAVFASPIDDSWESDLELLDTSVADPWERTR